MRVVALQAALAHAASAQAASTQGGFVEPRLCSLQQYPCKMSNAYKAALNVSPMNSDRCKASHAHLAPGQIKDGIVVRQPLCWGAILIMQASRQGCRSVKNGYIAFLICHRKVLAIIQNLHCMQRVRNDIYRSVHIYRLNLTDMFCDLQVLQMCYDISSSICASTLCAVKPGSNSQCGSRNRHTNLTVFYGKWRSTHSMRMHQNCAC